MNAKQAWDLVKSLSISEIAADLGLQFVKHGSVNDMVVCIFHDDKHGGGGTANMSLYKPKNKFRCFNCGANGSTIDLWAKAKGGSEKEAVLAMATEYNLLEAVEALSKPYTPPTTYKPKQKPQPAPEPSEKVKKQKKKYEYKPWDMEKIEIAATELLHSKNEAYLKKIMNRRQISKEYIQSKKIGLSKASGFFRAFIIPVFDAAGSLLTIRTHDAMAVKGNKDDKRFVGADNIAGDNTGGSKHLYDLSSYDRKASELFVCEGEGDLWTAEHALGKNAITAVCGAGALPDTFAQFIEEYIGTKDELLSKNRIVLVPDNDIAGLVAMAKIRCLLPKEAKVFSVHWTGMPDKADLSDFVIKFKGNAKALEPYIKLYTWDDAAYRIQIFQSSKSEAKETGNPVYEEANCYFKLVRSSKKKDKMIPVNLDKKKEKIEEKEKPEPENDHDHTDKQENKKEEGKKEEKEEKIEEKKNGNGEEGKSPDAVRISSFVFHPKCSVEMDREGWIKGDAISSNGHIESNVVIKPEGWRSKQNFMTNFPHHRYKFTGTDQDVQHIMERVSNVIKVTKKGTKSIGFIDGCFAGPGWAITEKGIVDDAHIEYIKQDIPLDTYMKFVDAPDVAQILKDFVEVLPLVNRPPVIWNIMGWMMSCFFKQQIWDTLSNFPIVVFFGTSGSGKTSLVMSLMRLFGLVKAKPFNSHATAFTAMRMLAGSNTVPLVVDELKEDAGKDTISFWQNRLRASYRGEIETRGTKDQKVISYEYQSPLIMIGEMAVIREQAAAERSICIRPERHHIAHASAQDSRDAFKKLEDDIPVEALFPSIVQWCLKEGFAIFNKEWARATHDFNKMKFSGLPTRVWKNYIPILFGLNQLENFCESHGVDFKITEKERYEAMESLVKDVLSVGKRSRMGFDDFIESLSTMASVGQIEHKKHYKRKDQWLYIHVSSCSASFKKWAKDTDFDGEVLGKTELYNQAREMVKMDYSYVKNASKATKFDENKTRKTVMVNLELAEKYGLDITGFGYSKLKTPDVYLDDPEEKDQEKLFDEPGQESKEIKREEPEATQKKWPKEWYETKYDKPEEEEEKKEDDDIFGGLS